MRLDNLNDETIADIRAWRLSPTARVGGEVESAELIRKSVGENFTYSGDTETLTFSLLGRGGPAMGGRRVTVRKEGARTYVSVPRWGTFATERRAIVYRRKGGYLLRARHGVETLFLEIFLLRPKETRLDLVPVRKKGGPFASIEIDVDAFHAMGLEWTVLVRDFTKQWIADSAFDGSATAWDWFTQSVNFGIEKNMTCFVVGLGFPPVFMRQLGAALKAKANGAVRAPSVYLTPNANDGWSPIVHVHEKKAWFMLDSIIWREV